MSEWKTYKLGDFITHKKGFAFKSNLYKDTGCPIIRVTNFTGNSISMNDILFIDIDQKDNFKEVEIKEDDIIIATVGSWPNNPSSIVGRVIKVPKVANGALLNQNAVIIYPNRNLDKKFLYYQLKEKNFSNYLVSGAQGSANQASIKLEQIYSYEFAAPEDKAKQQQIAQILTSLDNKIELNLQMNQTLEAMAQAIFKEWFVDFKFPGFYGELVNGLPKGWRMGKLGEEFNLTMGQSPAGSSYNELGEGMVFYQGRTDFGFRFPTNRLHTTEPKRIAKPLDTLVSVRAPVGDINMANEICCVGRGLSAVRHKSNAFSFTYYMMKNIEPIFRGFESEGTVFGSINKANFENIEIIVPEKSIIKEFEKIVNPIDNKILENANQIQTLTQTRDSLLPRLMSGKIEVK